MELKNLFYKGKMNKDLDERLVPNGEYTDALNIRVGKSSGSDVGALENEKGNTKLSFIDEGDSPVCIGSVSDEANEKIYWFVVDDNPSSYIYEFDQRNNVTATVLKDTRNGTAQVLNFDENHKITHANVLYDKESRDTILYFTDNRNPPRMVNIKRAKAYGENNFAAEDINLYKKPPRLAPEVTPYNTNVLEENAVSERHFAFAYRYKYLDGQFTALSSFTNYQFYPSLYDLDFETFENNGMINEFNAYSIAYNTGDKRVTDIQICFKTPLSDVVYVIDTINKQENGLFDNVSRSYNFTNKKVYKALPDDEMNRLFDNVPLKALAQDVVQNRLVFGNYTTQYDLKRNATDRTNLTIDYVAEHVSTSLNGDSQTYTRANSNKNIVLDLTNVSLIKGHRFTLYMDLDSAIGGTPPDDYFNGSFVGNNSVVLSRNYVDANDFYGSDDFTQLISSMNANFKSSVITTSPANTVTPITYGTFTKVSSTATSITLTAPSNTHTVDNTPGDSSDNDFTDFSEDFRWLETTEFLYRASASSLSLKSNRSFDFGLVYLDKEGRYSSIIPNSGDDGTSKSNFFVPVEYSDNINTAKITIKNKPPYWADRYKFFVKTNKDLHYNIFATTFYQDGLYAWVLLNGNNLHKVKEGMNLLVKSDDNGPLNSEVKVKVLEVTTKAGNDVVETAQGWIIGNEDNGGNPIKEIQGVFMKIRPNGFTLNQDDYSFLQYTGQQQQMLAGNVGVMIPLWEDDRGISQYSDDGGSTWTNLDLPQGSRVYLKFESWDSPDRNGDEVRYFEEDYIVKDTYTQQTGGASVLEQFLDAETNWNKPSGQSYYTDPDEQFRLTFNAASSARKTVDIVSTETTTLLEKGRIDVKISIQRTNGVIVFETDPDELDSDVYYEVSDAFDISGGFHTGNIQSQTASQDAIVSLNYGNCYSFGNGVESISVKDERFSSTLTMDLRPNITILDGYKEITETNGLIYSGTANENTGYNSLNEFNASRGNTKYLDLKYGSVQRIFGRETDLLVLQEDQVSKVLYSKNILQSPDGSGSLTQIEKVLGQTVPYAGEYGISKNPESFSEYGGRVYFTDATRGVVLRLSRDGITPISQLGMEGYFRDNLPLNKDKYNLGGYDPRYQEYVLTIGSSIANSPSVNVDYNSEISLAVQGGGNRTYSLNVGDTAGTVTFGYLVDTAMTVSVLYDGTTTTHNISNNGSFTLSVTSANLLNSSVAQITVSSANNGSYNVVHSRPAAVERELIVVVLNDVDDAGKTIQNRFYKANSQITDVNYYNKTDVFANNGIARNETLVAASTNIYMPADNDVIHLSSLQELAQNNGYFNSCNRIGYLVDSAVRTPSYVQSNATYVSETITSNNTQREITGSFTFSPSSNSDKLYLIFDYQNGSCTPTDEAVSGAGGGDSNPTP